MAKTSTKKLEREIEESLELAKTKRRQRDSIERPTPNRVLGRIDHALSTAEDQIGSYLATAETAQSSPQVYKLGNELFDDIEKIRWKIRRGAR
jgi:hypothetical protein